MSLVTVDHVQELIRQALNGYGNTITARINELRGQINEARPPVVEQFQDVVIDPNVDSGNGSLDLIKSVPEFDGDKKAYPAWRKAALFAMNYYPENSEKRYVATGILRNKITGSANTTLSSFNTVLNSRAILDRLDKSFADSRPLHVLENELSILRQNNLSLTDFYDTVDKQLTLIINKQIMTLNGQDDLIAALNDRARENALRVFISGLRRPLCDVLFSARPQDLPNALAIAEELEINHKRSDFARAYAAGNFIRTPRQKLYQATPQAVNSNRPIPMEIDSSRIVQRPYNHQNYISQPQNNKIIQGPNNLQNIPTKRFPNVTPAQQNYAQNFPPPQYPTQNTGAIPKRLRESDRSRFYKQQRINHMPVSTDTTHANSDTDEEDCQSVASEISDDVYNNEIHFLE